VQTNYSPRWRARCAAAFTRFWHASEQNRRVPLRETSTNTRSHVGAAHTPSRSACSLPITVASQVAIGGDLGNGQLLVVAQDVDLALSSRQLGDGGDQRAAALLSQRVGIG
jgi:hypothetical protein